MPPLYLQLGAEAANRSLNLFTYSTAQLFCALIFTPRESPAAVTSYSREKTELLPHLQNSCCVPHPELKGPQRGEESFEQHDFCGRAKVKDGETFLHVRRHQSPVGDGPPGLLLSEPWLEGPCLEAPFLLIESGAKSPMGKIQCIQCRCFTVEVITGEDKSTAKILR